MYKHFFKRLSDIVCALLALTVFSWLYIIIAILVRINLGSPVLFTQVRPGMTDKKTGKETLFKMYKFRTMTDERDENGNLLPDGERLTKFGEWLRATSLDELPEAINILKGDMSVVGPRPQLVRDMVFMTDEQRERHTVRPGLSGLAQVSGRNALAWDIKLKKDIEYIQKITFWGDVKIVFLTVYKAFIKHDDITQDDFDTAEDFGDHLLRIGAVDKETYDVLQTEALEILAKG